MNEINNILSDINHTTVTAEQVNKLISDISSTFTSSADTVFGAREQVRRNYNNNNKPWFNKECKQKRDAFHKINNKYRNNKTIETKTLLNSKAKEFRNELNKRYSKYQTKCANELRSHSKTNPKAYWRTLKKFSGNDKQNPPISIDTLYEYLKNLNNYEEDDDDIEIDHRSVCNNPIYNEILNGEITEKEIVDALKGLKNSKSPGLHNVLNEYLKNSPSEYIHVFKNIFNLVLDSGIVPDSWTIGIIKSIYKNKGDVKNPDNFRAITWISCLGKLFTSIINERLTFFFCKRSVIDFL
jgi:hypothetical protein